ncbi:MAG: 4'-phosphopantetheinyl transferase [Oceanicoccus sp.]|jgi:4'-phosphopantetheinyl transferase
MQLDVNDIHLWVVDLAHVPADKLSTYHQLMSPQELQRNQRFKFAAGQFSDATTRALVRNTLSRYADISPTQWQFTKGDHGKPEIANAGVKLRFNVSHTSQCIVCAVSRVYPVGVDVEYIGRKNDVLAIADRYFSESELSDLSVLPLDQQLDRFFDYWTLKEAYMKARGEGISLGLDNFGFRFDRRQIAIQTAKKLQDNDAAWQFRLFSPAKYQRMALAVKCGANELSKQESSAALNISLFNTLP